KQTAPVAASSSAVASTVTKPDENSSGPQTINAGSLNQRAARRVVPTYPKVAKNARVAGTVKVHVIVNENGEVQVTNSEGPTMLQKAAEDAARGWLFSPTYVEGKQVKVAGYIEFSFTL